MMERIPEQEIAEAAELFCMVFSAQQQFRIFSTFEDSTPATNMTADDADEHGYETKESIGRYPRSSASSVVISRGGKWIAVHWLRCEDFKRRFEGSLTQRREDAKGGGPSARAAFGITEKLFAPLRLCVRPLPFLVAAAGCAVVSAISCSDSSPGWSGTAA